MSYTPPWQPIRGMGNHRTHIKEPTDTYIPWKPNSVITQIQLYKWVHSLENFQNQTVIAELYGYLFYNFRKITKRDLGMTVVQAVRYNPRKLKGVTLNNPIVCSTYMIQDADDLKFGLEWMICTWLHKCKDTEDPKMILDFLDEMATCEEDKIDQLYMQPLGPWWDYFSRKTSEWSWENVWEACEYKRENDQAGPTEAIRPNLTPL